MLDFTFSASRVRRELSEHLGAFNVFYCNLDSERTTNLGANIARVMLSLAVTYQDGMADLVYVMDYIGVDGAIYCPPDIFLVNSYKVGTVDRLLRKEVLLRLYEAMSAESDSSDYPTEWLNAIK